MCPLTRELQLYASRLIAFACLVFALRFFSVLAEETSSRIIRFRSGIVP